MDRATLAAMARKHWAIWLPQKTADLKAAKEFGEATQAAAVAAQRQIQELISQGYRAHEAEEVALKQFILLAPEHPDEDDWEAKELAEKEDRYQEMMREPVYPDDE
jgi:hypothetical protein